MRPPYCWRGVAPTIASERGFSMVWIDAIWSLVQIVIAVFLSGELMQAEATSSAFAQRNQTVTACHDQRKSQRSAQWNGVDFRVQLPINTSEVHMEKKFINPEGLVKPGAYTPAISV